MFLSCWKRLGHTKDGEAQIAICEGLQELADPTHLTALQSALPMLDQWDGDAIRLMIIKLRGGDPVPDLLTLLREPACTKRNDIFAG